MCLNHSCAHSPQQAGPDTAFGDVMLCHISAFDRRRVGKLLLQNAFFRSALSSSITYRFIGRADDDAAVSLPALTSVLAQLNLRSAVREVVLGPIRSWYMWDPQTLRPVCYDAGWNRRRDACAHHTVLNNQQTDQCCASGLVGPFPLAGGAATVYSRSLLEEILLSGNVQLEQANLLFSAPIYERFLYSSQ